MRKSKTLVQPEQDLSEVEEKTRDLLLTLSFFDDFNIDEMNTMARHMNYAEIKRGEYLFMEGEKGDYLCFVVNGLLEVLKKNHEGEFRIIARLQKGNTIGEMSIVDKSPRSASVIARQSSLLIILTTKGFNRLGSKHPGLTLKLLIKIMRLLSLHMRRTSSWLADSMIS